MRRDDTYNRALRENPVVAAQFTRALAVAGERIEVPSYKMRTHTRSS
jgi:hypothetical protein